MYCHCTTLYCQVGELPMDTQYYANLKASTAANGMLHIPFAGYPLGVFYNQQVCMVHVLLHVCQLKIRFAFLPERQKYGVLVWVLASAVGCSLPLCTYQLMIEPPASYARHVGAHKTKRT